MAFRTFVTLTTCALRSRHAYTTGTLLWIHLLPSLFLSLARFLLQHTFKHTVGENFPGGIWEARRKRELSYQGNTAPRGVPRATPPAASRHLPEDIRRKAKEMKTK
ncbi:uncharacterized protein LOC109852862 [Pseudomyrmex gracilis]|uniref:uncharacterized protein LOC109852862 n=1 Tax=Pseudomyrmex gracilis TaxID=219809 RepID=UPI000995B46A|nr:uncharacterized protein LOC109852862 [Pseudomyrmex gracilis]